MLFIGAEGTLGIITEGLITPLHSLSLVANPSYPSVTIKRAPRLPTTVAIAQFPDVASACKAVTNIVNSSAGSHIRELSMVPFCICT
jgi:D-lactate dehydrogenase (cytochrome)